MVLGASDIVGAAIGEPAPANWDEMPTASIGGVEFPLGASTRRGGHTVARHKYTGRDAQGTEGLGRTPYIYDLTIPLFQGVNKKHYPELKNKLLDALEKDGGRTEYIDPEDGPIHVRVITYPWRRDPMRRNGGIFQVTLEEHYENFDELIGALADPKGLARVQAGEIDTGLEDAGVDELETAAAFAEGGYPLTEEELDFSPGDMIINMVDSFFDFLESGPMILDEIADALDTIRWRLDKIKNFDAIQAIDNWPIMYSITGLAETCSGEAKKSYSKGPALILWVVPKKMSSVAISNSLYGNPNRAAEIEQLNPVRNPLFYPKDKELLVYSE